MKLFLPVLVPALAGLLFLSPASHAANQDVGAVILKQFGEAQLTNIVLIVSLATDQEPKSWKVYARDPFRPGELVCSVATNKDGKWQAVPESAGRLLRHVPRQTVNFNKLKIEPSEVRQVVNKAATAAKADVKTMSYQLAANEDSGAPEWGVALQDATGYEVGFCVVSAETGKILSEDWTPRRTGRSLRAQDQPEDESNAAAKRLRKKWRFTEEGETGVSGLFKIFK